MAHTSFVSRGLDTEMKLYLVTFGVFRVKIGSHKKIFGGEAACPCGSTCLNLICLPVCRDLKTLTTVTVRDHTWPHVCVYHINKLTIH